MGSYTSPCTGKTQADCDNTAGCMWDGASPGTCRDSGAGGSYTGGTYSGGPSCDIYNPGPSGPPNGQLDEQGCSENPQCMVNYNAAGGPKCETDPNYNPGGMTGGSHTGGGCPDKMNQYDCENSGCMWSAGACMPHPNSNTGGSYTGGAGAGGSYTGGGTMVGGSGGGVTTVGGSGGGVTTVGGGSYGGGGSYTGGAGAGGSYTGGGSY